MVVESSRRTIRARAPFAAVRARRAARASKSSAATTPIAIQTAVMPAAPRSRGGGYPGAGCGNRVLACWYSRHVREATAPTAHARPRAVADLPLGGLAAGAGELARRWAIALIEQRPLDQLGAVPLEEVVARGPALLESVLAALGSDEALERLAGTGA